MASHAPGCPWESVSGPLGRLPGKGILYPPILHTIGLAAVYCDNVIKFIPLMKVVLRKTTEKEDRTFNWWGHKID